METGETSGGRALRADAQRNRKHLLDVAREVFADGGPEAPLEEIARRAGVGIGTLYRHFPSRIDLIEAMYAEQMEELIALAQRLSETKPVDEALFTWLRAETKTTITFRAIKLYLMSGNPEGRTVTFGWKERLMEALGLLLRNAQAKGVVRKGIDAGSVLRLVHGVVTAAESASDGSGRQASQLLDVVIDGLRAQAK